MKIYSSLSKLGWLSKYSYKFLFVAFIGIHIPLIGIIVFIIFSQGNNLSPATIIFISLVLTLIATGATLYFLNLLLAPLIKSKEALENYIDKNILPELPINYTDEAGILMQKLQYTTTQLDDLVKAKDDLISLMSHDVRTPLTHIISYAEILKSTPDKTKLDEYADKIIHSGNDQLQMLESILTLLQQQGVNLTDTDKETVNVSNLITENIDRVSETIKAKQLEVKISGEDSISIQVNKNLFSHVIYNVIHNACKFSEEKGIISIRFEKTTDGKFALQIADEGIGFNPTFADEIFERFTKFGQQGTSGESSTGLGLYVCKRIIEKHNGKISAFSEGKNKGASFKIELK